MPRVKLSDADKRHGGATPNRVSLGSKSEGRLKEISASRSVSSPRPTSCAVSFSAVAVMTTLFTSQEDLFFEVPFSFKVPFFFEEPSSFAVMQPSFSKHFVSKG